MKLMYEQGMGQNSLIKQPTKNVLFLVGPDTFESSKSYFAFKEYIELAEKFLRESGIIVTRVGDGQVNTVMNITHIRNAIARQPEGSAIFVLAHGKNYAPVHHYLANQRMLGRFLDDGIDIPEKIETVRIFKMMREVGRRMDMVMMSCGSGMAHPDANEQLPQGSRFLTIGSGKENPSQKLIAFMLSINTLEKSLENGAFSYHKFILNILPFLGFFNNNTTPMLTVAGQGSCQLSDMLDDHVGRPFTNLEQLLIRYRIDDFNLTKDGHLLKEIEQKAESVKQGGSAFGASLALVLAANQMRVPLKTLSS